MKDRSKCARIRTEGTTRGLVPSSPVFAERRQHRRIEHDCPICDERPSEVLFSREEVDAELALREKFFVRRVDEYFMHRALRDVTDAALGIPAAILQCQRCDYRTLLPAGAHVLEVGSYAGGFMRVAQEWEWRAIGSDIGRDTARFSRSLGLNVHELHLDDCPLAAASLDAVFVWNCFEQVPDAGVLVAQAERLLREGGLFTPMPQYEEYARGAGYVNAYAAFRNEVESTSSPKK